MSQSVGALRRDMSAKEMVADLDARILARKSITVQL